MEQLAEYVLELKEYKGKNKLAMSKVVRAKVEDEIQKTEDKILLLGRRRRHRRHRHSKKLIKTKKPNKNR